MGYSRVMHHNLNGLILLGGSLANKMLLLVAKTIPNSWIGCCHGEFIKKHPGETELPWQDIGCTKLLNSMGQG